MKTLKVKQSFQKRSNCNQEKAYVLHATTKEKWTNNLKWVVFPGHGLHAFCFLPLFYALFLTSSIRAKTESFIVPLVGKLLINSLLDAYEKVK